MEDKNCLKYEGGSHLRQQILLSVLSGRPVKISIPMSIDTDGGFKSYEKDLLTFVCKLSSGASVKISSTSTELIFEPGILEGGKIEHECDTGRGIGYYLELAICLAPFVKRHLELKLTGSTNNPCDSSVDSIIYSSIPVLKRFIDGGHDVKLELKKRGVAPDIGGEVHFQCRIMKRLKPVQLEQPGKVYRIRGISWTTRVSPGMNKRMTDAAKQILEGSFPNMFITSDHRKGGTGGRSPGFGITLVAETKEGEFYCAEAMSAPKGSSETPSVAEDVGKEAAIKLLIEISKGGCMDMQNQFIACTFMLFNTKNISKMLFGELTDYTIYYLRHVRDFLGTMFKIDSMKDDKSEEDSKYMLSCLGLGYSNISRRCL